MIEKILSFEELKLRDLDLTNQDLKKIVDDLTEIEFFSQEEGDKNKYCKKVFSILRKNPNKNDNLKGQQYIREEYFENEKLSNGKIYNFDLKVVSTIS